MENYSSLNDTMACIMYMVLTQFLIIVLKIKGKLLEPFHVYCVLSTCFIDQTAHIEGCRQYYFDRLRFPWTIFLVPV